MVGTGLIRDCIKESDKTSQIPSVIAAGQAQYGMQTFDQSLLGLYREELITYEVARDAATNADDFDLKVKGIFSTGEMTWETGGAGQQAHGLPGGPRSTPGAVPRPSGASGGGPFSKRP
jgi:twitching motility protein PilT